MNVIPIQLHIPPLYRYLDEQYVDMFFNLGVLRISSFEQFKKHKDEARLDTQEGKACLVGKCKNNPLQLRIGFGVGNNFVLCTSFLKSIKIAEEFKANSCFEIFDPMAFMQKIGDALQKRNFPLGRILHGFCQYKDVREIYNELSEEDMKKAQYSLHANTFFSLAAKMMKDDIFFLKSNDYRQQAEYRLIWSINSDDIPEYIDLYVPDAVQFCRKINFY